VTLVARRTPLREEPVIDYGQQQKIAGQTLAALLGQTASALAIGAILLLLYGLAWTYSTHRYLKGFADAIIPLNGSPQQKTEALLEWLRHAPERRDELLHGSNAKLRDPVLILQSSRLLKVCGTATNAFINLGDAAGLKTRRLLLLDASGSTMHVVAEVRWDDRWVSVDPQRGLVFRDHLGHALTKEELHDPEIFQDAISRMPNYRPTYSFERTAYIHLQRLPFLGDWLPRMLDQFFPRWEEAIDWGYLPENRSLWPVVASLPLLLLGVLIRLVGNLYGRNWFGCERLKNPQEFSDSFREKNIPASIKSL